jgi:ABC-type dipeptide/oligopeptide/nickel transport system permease subunit
MTEEKKKRRSFEDQLRIADRTSCEQAIRNGGVAALVVAGLTTIGAIAGFFVETSDERLRSALDPWALLDVALIVVLAVFIFRKSRVASTLMLVYYVVSKILQVMDGGGSAGLFVAVFFVLWFVTAMRGTYLWHSKYRHEAAAPEVAS